MKRVGLAVDELFVKHDNGPDHPESPDRIYAINDMIHESNLIQNLKVLKPRDASDKDLLRVHNNEYINKIKSTKDKDRVFLDQDTSTNTFSFDAAIRASGAVLENIDNILDNILDTGFSLVRPPGHHAEYDRAMGFCLFNHIAVGAAYLSAKGYKNILIVDIDVHHGNGTQHIFESSNNILYFSTHQYPFYPGSGSLGEIGIDEGKGFTVNIPIPAGYGDNEHIAIYNELLIPIAKTYKPDFILVSAGFDSHVDDPLGGMNLSSECYSKITRLLLDIADQHSNGKILFMLEGGYNLNALWESTRYVFNELLDLHKSKYNSYNSDTARPIIEQVKDIHKDFWEFN